MAIIGAKHFYDTFVDVMSKTSIHHHLNARNLTLILDIIGYWSAVFATIILTEHIIFRHNSFSSSSFRNRSSSLILRSSSSFRARSSSSFFNFSFSSSSLRARSSSSSLRLFSSSFFIYSTLLTYFSFFPLILNLIIIHFTSYFTSSSILQTISNPPFLPHFQIYTL